ncbi:hypothetical protein CLOSYM_02165 [[Clostridium] symbiosum ATCC 14940]|uniref:Uncharacterized protein n=1 Tax=[Clostridium] symbiosum ATCC 14940 TaxID=411472 RepID=A0ABC9TYH3_CLOSY|nr:hypothetical protein CLOSYM_02165 [[Clostridium] symbiosum ATCC 14940]
MFKTGPCPNKKNPLLYEAADFLYLKNTIPVLPFYRRTRTATYKL